MIRLHTHTHTHTHVNFCKKCKIEKIKIEENVKNVNQY